MANDDVFKQAVVQTPLQAVKNITVTIPEEIDAIITDYRVNRRMIIARFINKVIDIYTSNEDIVFALVNISESGVTGAKVSHVYTIPEELHSRIKMLKEMTGINMGHIASRCLIHAVSELQAELPFGSTIKGLKRN